MYVVLFGIRIREFQVHAYSLHGRPSHVARSNLRSLFFPLSLFASFPSLLVWHEQTFFFLQCLFLSVFPPWQTPVRAIERRAPREVKSSEGSQVGGGNEKKKINKIKTRRSKFRDENSRIFQTAIERVEPENMEIVLPQSRLATILSTKRKCSSDFRPMRGKSLMADEKMVGREDKDAVPVRITDKVTLADRCYIRSALDHNPDLNNCCDGISCRRGCRHFTSTSWSNPPDL